MFGWRKRSEGFEWKEYVRTTILVRRADRQRRLDEARLKAVARAKEVKDRNVEAGKAHARALISDFVSRMTRTASGLARAVLAAVVRVAHSAWSAVTATRNMLRAARPDNVALPDAVKEAASLAALYSGDLPRRWRRVKPHLLPFAAAITGIYVFGAVLTPSASVKRSSMTAAVTTGSVSAAAYDNNKADETVLRGKASAVAGNELRIGGHLVRLSGIEVPEKGQACTTESGRTWDCGSSALNALQHLIRGHKVACEVEPRAGNEAEYASCRAGETDIARELVRRGHAFADTADARYMSEEERAKTEHAGLWQGEVQRPQEWRSKRWDEAKKDSPDGCPIKGFVKSSGRIYAMPWTAGYASRDLKPVKGERWFCSEDEARAAGFRLSSRL